ncbi:MAG: hypothetical protein AB1646_25370 [Thermodesulfobacteriota bacterium]
MAKSKTGIAFEAVLVVVFGSWEVLRLSPANARDPSHLGGSSQVRYTGSESCSKCIEKFYQLRTCPTGISYTSSFAWRL